MANLQDRICNGLTLVGLLCVIGFGIASLRPEAEALPEPEPAPQVPQEASVPPDTLEEVPMVEDRPAPKPEIPDSLKPDTLKAVPADTLHAPAAAGKQPAVAPGAGHAHPAAPPAAPAEPHPAAPRGADTARHAR